MTRRDRLGRAWAYLVLVTWVGAFVGVALDWDSDPKVDWLLFVVPLTALFGPMVLFMLYYAWMEWKGQPK